MHDSPIPISAISHWVYCHRRAMLIHLERIWEENLYTAEGRVMHEKAHNGEDETLEMRRIVRGLKLSSSKYNLIGEADVVEFIPPLGISPASLKKNLSDRLSGDEIDLNGWNCWPVEYKRGGPKKYNADRLQLAAQAICLEEMLGISVKRGYLFYGSIRRREEVAINEELRNQLIEVIISLQDCFDRRHTPEPVNDKRCEKCSLREVCLPNAGPSAIAWFKRFLSKALLSKGLESEDL